MALRPTEQPPPPPNRPSPRPISMEDHRSLTDSSPFPQIQSQRREKREVVRRFLSWIGRDVYAEAAMDNKELSIPPPTHPLPDPVPYPESVLLQPQAYLDDRTNATTAVDFTTNDQKIHVTFWLAPPPCLSYFTVHCPGVSLGEFAEMPLIIATEGSLVLLRVAICPQIMRREPECNDYFVYRAGPGKPSLQHLPNPCRVFADDHVGLLRLGHDGFVVAALRWGFQVGHYDLYLFNSSSRKWITKSMYFESSRKFTFTITSKVITIGGKDGSIGWVDLWHGILICDIFIDNNVLRFIPLPSLLIPRRMSLRGCPLSVRDIVVIKGSIKYFEMFTHASEGWVAATWTWMDSNWKADCKLNASEVQVDNPGHLELLRDLLGDLLDDEAESTLGDLIAGHPALSMHADDVIYIMAIAADCLDDNARVLAVDMRNKTVQEVVDVSAWRTQGFGFTYHQSDFSKHLDARSVTRHRYIRGAAETSADGIARGGKQNAADTTWEARQS